MSEDLTQNLHPRPFEERVLAELSAMRRENAARFDALDTRVASLEGRMTTLEGRMTTLEGRMTSLEEIVNARLHDTRPMWEAVQERLTGIEKEMRGLNHHLKKFAGELGMLRNRVDELEEDVEDLAQKRA
jgi:predicted nuclease with TOPRIM domain